MTVAGIHSIDTPAFAADARVETNGELRCPLKGTADKAAHSFLSAFLSEVSDYVNAHGTTEAVFELDGLFFIDPPSLQLFLRFEEKIIAAQGALRCMLRFRLNPRLTWQERTFATLCGLSRGRITTE